MNKFELQEKDLQLVVSEKVLGTLVTNAKDIKAQVEKALPNYDISNYNEDNIDTAKKDKAMLNTASKALNDKRISVEKEFMKPFEEFKGIVNDTVALIKQASSKIDEVVKLEEIKTKEIKKLSIEELWATKDFELILLSKIWQDKWLNKGTKIDSISNDMDSEILNINNDILTIEAIGEDTDLLKSLYLDTLNLGNTIRYAKTLKENREKAQKDAEERAEAGRIRAELQAKQKEEARIKAEEIKNAPPKFEPEKPVERHVEIMPVITPKFQHDEPVLLVRTMRVTATREQIIMLADFMNEQGIKFEKVEV